MDYNFYRVTDSTTATDITTCKDIAFSYNTGFYCPNCKNSVSPDITTCRVCGQLLRNPYEYIRGNKKYETNTAYIPGQDH